MGVWFKDVCVSCAFLVCSYMFIYIFARCLVRTLWGKTDLYFKLKREGVDKLSVDSRFPKEVPNTEIKP